MYVKVTNGAVSEYPYSILKLRRDNPNVSFPKEVSLSLLAEYGVFPVTQVEAPSSTITTDPEEQTPQFVNGSWTQVWVMVATSAEDAAQRQIDADDEVRTLAVKADAFVKNFISMTPAQVATYVEGNTANLAQVRSMMTKMALMLLALARKEYR